MPVYEIEHPKTGQKIRLEGEGMPTDADIREAFASVKIQPRQTVTGDINASPADTERMRREFVAKEGTLGTRVKESLRSAATPAEIPRFIADAGVATINAGMRGLKSVASTVQGGGEAIRQGSIDAGLQKYAQKQAEFEPMQSPLQPSGIGQAFGEVAGAGVSKLSDLTGRPDIVEPVAQGVMDIGALVGARAAIKPTLRTVGKVSETAGAVRKATRPEMTELQGLSREHGVPLTAGEELSSPNLKQIESRLERLPGLGIRGFRKKQADSLAQGAQNLADEFATAVEDPATALADRYKSNLKKGKEESGAAYRQIDEALAENGDAGAIETVTTRPILKGLLSKSPDIFERLPGSQNRLKSIMAEIAGDMAPKKAEIMVADQSGIVGAPSKSLLGPDGKPITRQTTPKLTYDDYVWLRGQLGEYIDRAHSSAGALGSNELRQLTIIKKALDTDFYRWGKNSGYENVTAAVDNARNVYKTKVAPFENVPVLKSIVNDKFTPEQLLDAIAKPGQATLATRAMKGLKPADKVLVQDAIMRRAIALGYEGAKDGAPISAAKFATFFEKMDTRTKNAAQSPLDVFFSPVEKQRVMGFAKLARAAERASQYSANPLTGVAAADFAIPGALATMFGTVGAPAAAGAAAFTKTMSVLLSSERGKALLHRAYRTPAGATAAWQSIMQGVSKIMKDQRGMVGKDINASDFRQQAIADRDSAYQEYARQLDKERPSNVATNTPQVKEQLEIPALTLDQIPKALGHSGFSPKVQRDVVRYLKEVVSYGNKMTGKPDKSPIFGKAEIQEALDALGIQGRNQLR